MPAEVLEAQVEVRTRRGIDLNPVDVTSEHGARLLRAFIWPGRVERGQRLKKAIEIFRREPPVLVRGDYVELLPGLLAERDEGALTVVFQTASTGYLRPEQRADLRELLESAGREGPLGWISTRAVEEREEKRDDSYELEIAHWPGGKRRFLLPVRFPRQLDQVARVITSASNPRLKLVRKLGVAAAAREARAVRGRGRGPRRRARSRAGGSWSSLSWTPSGLRRSSCRRPRALRRSCSRQFPGLGTRRG